MPNPPQIIDFSVDLGDDEHWEVLAFLLECLNHGQLEFGALAQCAKIFNRPHSTISEFWSRWHEIHMPKPKKRKNLRLVLKKEDPKDMREAK